MGTPRYHTVIFDCDGTLLNTLEDLAAAGNAVCARHGWPTYTTEQYKRKVGNGQLMLARRLMPPMIASSAQAVAQVCDEFSAYYAEHKGDHTAPYPGIIELLDRLRAAGVRLAVLTNKNDAPAQELIASFFGERFDCVQGRTDALPPKPAPAMMRAALRRLGVEDAELAAPAAGTTAGPLDADEGTPNPLAGFLMVGDTDVDVLAGRNVGMDACGVLWGFRERDELERAGAVRIVATPAELGDFVLGTEADEPAGPAPQPAGDTEA